MLKWFKENPTDNQYKYASLLLESSTYRVVAYFEEEKKHVFTNVQLNLEVTSILDKIYIAKLNLHITGNLIKFILDNDYPFDESKLKLTGYLSTQLDDFTQNKNTMQYNGLKAAMQAYKSKKINFDLIEWHIEAKPYTRSVNKVLSTQYGTAIF